MVFKLRFDTSHYVESLAKKMKIWSVNSLEIAFLLKKVRNSRE